MKIIVQVIMIIIIRSTYFNIIHPSNYLQIFFTTHRINQAVSDYKSRPVLQCLPLSADYMTGL